MYTKQDLKDYIWGAEGIEEKTDMLNFIPDAIGPTILKEGILEEDDLQFHLLDIDWCATLNDFLVYESEETFQKIYDLVENKFN